MKAIDTNGRQIREGDRVDTRTVGPLHVTRIEGEDVYVAWKHLDGKHRPLPFHASNCTITHRSGEPIDDISPLVRDRNGKVIERGVRVEFVSGRQELAWDAEVVSVYGGRMILRKNEAEWEGYRCNEFTVLPDEPEKLTTTLTIRHAATLDPRKAIQAIQGLTVQP